MRKRELLLQMGYWSDEMEARGEGPDVFFITFTVHRERDAVELLGEAVELLLEAWFEKYGTWEDDEAYESPDTDRMDLFWECSARPA